MTGCEGLLTETLTGAFVCSNGRDCAVLPWLLACFSTGGVRVSQRVRSSHQNSETRPAPLLAESWEVSEAVLNAFEALAEDILDTAKPAVMPYVLPMVL